MQQGRAAARPGQAHPSRLNGRVPWCTSCDRFLSPSTVRADGACPTCGRPVDPGRAHAASGPGTAADATDGSQVAPATPPVAADVETDDDDEHVPIPWHLWLLLAALAVYLGYRAFQGLEWVFGI